MHNLQRQLHASYAQHPSFQFDAPTWRVEPDLVSAFVEHYAVVRDFKVRLAPAEIQSCRQHCVAGLAALFQHLRPQVADGLEHAFLAELEMECTRLLHDEFAWHLASPSRAFVSFGSRRVRGDALQLEQEKYYFGKISPACVHEILAVGAGELERCRANVSRGQLRRDDLSVNSGPVIRRIAQLVNREFHDMGVLATVGAYAGCRMTVTGLALELSVSQASWWANTLEGPGRAPLTLYAHVDEAIRYPKAIVYLSDVDEGSGPTACYPRAFERLDLNPLQELVGRVVGNVGNAVDSPLRGYYGRKYHQAMSSERFRKHFMRLPSEMRFNSHLGWDVLPDSALEQELVSSECRMLGEAGSFIAFDGARLLHRGGMVHSGERIALQVVFSSTTRAGRLVGRIKRVLS